MAGFRVDTKLFQELGELLVAKESTALVELIKNAYDADATLVTVTGTKLDDPAHGSIVVVDDGVGMNQAEFEKGFLTIAGRTKNSGDRRSPVFGRRYTGEKGVGRLASHKLGTALDVRSRKAGPAERGASALPGPISELRARIDWAAIEELETLDQVNSSSAVRMEEDPLRPVRARVGGSGTTLKISPLRVAWTQRTKSNFLREAATLAPHPVTWKPLPKGLMAEPLLFDQIPFRDQDSSDPGFEVVFGGDLSLGDRLLPEVAEAADWIAEILFDRETGQIDVAVSPTNGARKVFPTAEGFRFSKKLKKHAGPSFRARILQRRGIWEPEIQGVRVFMEGFRVPPYGDRTDDWLRLETDYTSRAKRKLIRLEQIESADLPAGLEQEQLVLQGNAAYFGAVFLHRSSSPGLEMLVNREGFLPGSAFDFITDWVRIGTDLIVRVKYLASQEIKEVRKEERARQRSFSARSDVNETPTALRVRESTMRAQTKFEQIKQAVEREDYSAAARISAEIQPTLQEVRELADQFGSEAVQWRVLASLGTELAAFVHEVNAVGLQIGGLARDLEDATALPNMTKMRASIRRAHQRAMDLAERIRRNATYLVDATSFEGRRRRSRQPLRDRFESVRLFFESRIEQKQIAVRNEVDAGLKTPPMFPSEVAGIFMNLLSNAVKFTDEGGRIRVYGHEKDGLFHVQMDNTGAAVDLPKSDRLFEAFRSTTERPDAVLGQGMGMGLTITRAFIQEYGGDIRFQKPPAGYATSITFSIPLK